MIVIFSGYENFVSRIDAAEHADWPEWMAKIDFTGLKLKLLSSIVAISAIQLLRAFMDVKNTADRESLVVCRHPPRLRRVRPGARDHRPGFGASARPQRVMMSALNRRVPRAA